MFSICEAVFFTYIVIDQTVLKYVEPAGQSWDGTETPERLVNTTVMGKEIF